jgi:hypothetical protein
MSRGRPTRRRTALVAVLTAAICLSLGAAAHAIPIVSVGMTSLPTFQGEAATAHPIRHPTRSERNPFMAVNPNSNIHNDTWMTDAYNRPGPLGESLQTDSAQYKSALCGSIAFDSQGRIVTVCPSIPFPPEARIIDPDTLEIIDSYVLPNAPSPPGTHEYQNFAGGGYFFLDAQDRIWVATRTDHLFVLDEGEDGDTLRVRRDYDLTGVLDTETERISSALPDFGGLIWFVSKKNGKVGTLDPKTGDIELIKLDEEIENSFAVASDGVYIVSDKRMYRFRAGKDGTPRVVWKKHYPDSGIVKPSQVNAGSGTTPTVMKGGYVAITDNADPMNVVVYRRGRHLHGKHRVVCKVPVFEKGASATENSLIGERRSLIVENNYGYQDPFGPKTGALTEAGFARVDIKRNGKGCRKVWENTEARAPTVVPKLSTKTGLIYTYTHPKDPTGNQGYFWTALDYRTGNTAWSKYAGSGLSYNNNYAGIALGPDGTEYLAVIGGMLALRDGG